nr:unnamed protein product [Callosobruchus chinensis]
MIITILNKMTNFKTETIIFNSDEKFISLAPFEECHSVDESWCLLRRPWIETIHTSKGYIEWFEPYQGCTTIISEKYRPLGLGASIVLQFSDIMQVQNGGAPFHIFCDNFLPLCLC